MSPLRRGRFGDQRDPELVALVEEEEEQKRERERDRQGYSNRSTGESIINELVKSYGFRQNRYGQWDWSLENIGKSFKEDPVWTTIDYLTLAVAPAKWGVAAAQVSRGARGAGSIGKAYKAGHFAGRQAESGIGRFFGSFVGQEKAAAAELHLAGGGKRFQFFKNPVTSKYSEEHLELMKRFGPEDWEKRGLAKAFERERLIAENHSRRMSSDLQRQWERAGLTEEQKGKAMRFLEHRSADPNKPLHAEVIRGALGAKGYDAYRRTYDFRNYIHESARKFNLISEETYRRNLGKYAPRLYEEYTSLLRGIPGPSVVSGSGGKGAAARFAGRQSERGSEVLTRVLSPTLIAEELGEAGQLIARQEFAQRLTSSVIARNADEVAGLAEHILADPKLAKLHNVDERVAAALAKNIDNMKAVDAYDPETIAERLGWRRLDQLFTERNRAIPGYLEKLPDALKGKWIDPAVADDVVGITKFLEKPGLFTKWYHNALGLFKATKTAYNPATHVRNWFGAMVFHHLAVGGVPKLAPREGFWAYRKQTAEYLEAVKAGIVGSSYDLEIRNLARAWTESGEVIGKGKATALEPFLGRADELGFKAAAKAMKGTEKVAGRMERIYRGTDEVWKLDAFIERKRKYLARGLTNEDAISAAARDVNKFMPGFLSHSEFGRLASEAIPFASFTTEALRVWKNALAEKPHLAFFWNHIAESMSHTLGAMAGYSEQELQAATESLPYHMENKKLMVLPFNVDGKPMFLDLSYLIPLANIVEVERGNNLFFDELYAPGTAPVVGIAAAIGTGTDPFSGRPITPDFTERQLGIAVESERGRKMVGLAEYMARMFLPPVVPPGYAGVNLLEFARGQKHPVTGEALEEGVKRTVAGNIFGMRAYGADTESQILNLKHEQKVNQDRVTEAWRRYSYALANGDLKTMQREKKRIVSLKVSEGADDPIDYFEKGALKRIPGEFTSMTTKQITEILARAERAGPLSPRDERVRGALMARLQSRADRKRKKRTR